MKTNRLIALLLALLLTFICPAGGPVPAEAEADAAEPTDGYEEDEPDYETPEPYVGYRVAGGSLTISEDAVAEQENRDVTAVLVTGTGGEQSTVTVEGGITVRGACDSVSHGTATGLEVISNGSGSKAEATVAEGVISVMKWTNPGEGDNINCGGISITTEEGSAEVTVGNGGIHAEATAAESEDSSYTWAAGVHLYNTDGTARVQIGGNVTAESTVYGVGLNSHLDGEKDASTLIRVEGDVYGTTRAIWAEMGNPGGTMELIVNGTVSGGIDNILVSGAHKERVLLTVWRIAPDADGALVRTLDDMENGIPSPEDEAALQYIIRVSAEDSTLVETEAEDYHGYPVAKAGETVRVRVSAPSGFRVAGVFADKEQTAALEQDADGSYILIVPRGGGVELSAVTEPAE